MADDEKTEDAETAQAAALKKISTILAIVVVIEVFIAILLLNISRNMMRMRVVVPDALPASAQPK